MNTSINKIVSCVGGHEINIVSGATFDPAIRKYRGGQVVATIPYGGFMLNAKAAQHEAEPVVVDGIAVPTKTPQQWVQVDDLPQDDGNTFYIVSAMYVAAAKSLGRDTSRLLTMGQTVVEDDGRTIKGTVGFNRN